MVKLYPIAIARIDFLNFEIYFLEFQWVSVSMVILRAIVYILTVT